MDNLLKQKIFDKCVEIYLMRGKPVGSRILKRKCFKNLGESTLRLYLNRLVKDEYLENLSNFSGRIPTDLGWRQFYLLNLKRVKITPKEINSFQNKSLNEKINLIAEKNKVYYLIKESDGHLEEGGLDSILENLEFESEKMVFYFASFLKILKANLRNLLSKMNDDLVLYIGKENPLKYKEVSYFSTIFKRVGNKFLCFISIKRQNYPYVVELINKVFNE